ncbi:MAG: hypothetical protein M3389_17105, partial [Actinomycetota bacterium]|nr:hypothetical protein [Actinomycetota bacterium]
MIPLADNCSGLSDCSFEIKIALAVVAIVLLLALLAMVGPALAGALRAAVALGRSRGAAGLLGRLLGRGRP